MFPDFPLMFLSLANSTKFDKIGGVVAPKSLALEENWLNCKEKASFVLILTKSGEPIFLKCWANFENIQP